MDKQKEVSENEMKKNLINYKKLTLTLIDSLEKQDYDSLDELIDKRQSLINRMEKLSYSKEEFRNICEELQILILQKKLSDIMNEKRADVRREINKLSATKTASMTYCKGFKVDSIFFNKKI